MEKWLHHNIQLDITSKCRDMEVPGLLGGVLHKDDELHDEGDAQVPEEDEGREYPPELEALDLSCRRQTAQKTL
jgi:hypothetical protein